VTGTPLPYEMLGFRTTRSVREGTVWYEGPAQLHRTGHPETLQNVTAVLIGEESRECECRHPSLPINPYAFLDCLCLYRPIVRVSPPDDGPVPPRPQDLRFPFVGAGGHMPAPWEALQEWAWTVVFPLEAPPWPSARCAERSGVSGLHRD